MIELTSQLMFWCCDEKSRMVNLRTCLYINLLHAMGDFVSQQNLQNNFSQCRSTLMMHRGSLDMGNVFKKLKHGSIISGC